MARRCGAADPSAIWVKDGRYYLLTGNLLVQIEYGRKRGQAEHQGDTLYLFRSDDLVHWEYLHPFYQSEREWTRADEDDMCPDFFPLGDRHMLLFISHNLGCQYYIGRYADDHFYPEHPRAHELGGPRLFRAGEPAGRAGPAHHVGLDL